MQGKISKLKYTEDKNIYYMNLAMKEAQKAFNKDEVPIGAIIVNTETNKIIAKTHNLCEKKKNPTLHAELIAINKACKKLNTKILNNCEIYISKEPCPMCATALSYTRIKHIYFALEDEKGGAFNGCKDNSIYENNPNLFKVPFSSGILKEESKKLIQLFFKSKR